MKKIILSICLLFNSFFVVFAQTNSSSSEILQSLHQLNTLGSVLYIAAHPDDENTRLLTYLSKERKYRTAYLSLTRGDGGQNLIGKEQGDMLGLIRTEELLAARRIDGAEQWFTRAVDFGYSKNPEETFRFWNKDSVLADVVFAIRMFRPDVIICRFPTTGEGGHGHHTASALLAVEAFDLANDPTKFPEQLKYVQIWQPKRLFWNTFNFGTNNTTAPDQLTIDVGAYNTLLGKSYGEIAAMSRTCHKSQGFGSGLQRGSQLEYFKQLKGDTARKDIFEGINTTWERLPGGKKMSQKISSVIQKFNHQKPELSIKSLYEITELMKPYFLGNSKWWADYKANQLSDLILSCAGIWIETSTADYRATPGKEIEITSKLVMRNNGKINLKSLTYTDIDYLYFDTSMNLKLVQNKVYSFTHKLTLSENMAYSTPHWLKNKHGNGWYTVDQMPLNGLPEKRINFVADIQLEFEEAGSKESHFTHPIKYKYTDPVKGEIYRPVEILPPATVTPGVNTIVCRNGDVKTIYFLVKANVDHLKGSLLLIADKTCQFELINPNFELAKKGDEVLIEAQLRIHHPNYQGYLQASVLIDGKTYSYGIQRIEYDHIPNRFMLTDARVKLLRFDLNISGKKIAYIPGAGDEVESCLKDIGYEVTSLSDEMIKNSDLSVYEAIVTGVRAYNTNDKLPLYHKQLMDYVQKGGRLIVQYNTNSRVGPLQNNIGPYKFTISRNRVTDENANIKFINDSVSILNYPNKITELDFKDWVQERGIYFATEFDSTYQTVFSINDPGEADQTGSLIWAQYGKGCFVYTGLAFFRQLPAGVPGAYRLFSNILSIPVKKP